MEILAFITSHWVEWLFAGVSALLGVQSLLRESLVDNFNKYSDRGFCPIYAKESIKKVYAAYHQLGGNDVATELYNKLLKMKEETGNED